MSRVEALGSATRILRRGLRSGPAYATGILTLRVGRLRFRSGRAICFMLPVKCRTNLVAQAD